MNLLRFDSEHAWIHGVVTFWRDRLRLQPDLRMCLTTGNTPLPVYAEMSRSVTQGQVSFRHAAVFGLDEYGDLPSDDAGLCRNMLGRHLLDHIDLPKTAFDVLNPAASDLEAECRRYEAAIGRGFDLAILGIGLNGHLGLNEPGSAPDSGVRRIHLAESTISASKNYVSHGRLPTWGLGVGLKQLLGANEVWLLATGPSKASVIRRTLAAPIGSDIPATWLRNHPNCTFFLDTPAAAEIML